MNLEAINRTINLVKKAPPEQCQMKDFCEDNVLSLHPEDFKRSKPKITCGTAHCAAGWAIAANFQIAAKACAAIQKQRQSLEVNIERIAAAVLDIDNHQSDQLFLINTSEYGEDKIRIAATLAKHGLIWHWNILTNFDRLPHDLRKQALINVLEILRDTGQVDWPLALEKADATYQQPTA